MMKKLILIALFIPTYVLANAPTFYGTYFSQNDARVLYKTKIEVVESKSTAGKARFDELLKDHYMCELKNMEESIWRCELYSKEPSIADDRALLMHNKAVSSFNIMFEEKNVTPILVSGQNYTKEYLYKQKLQFQNKVFSKFYFLDMGFSQQIYFRELDDLYFTYKDNQLIVKKAYPIQLSDRTGELVFIESSFLN